VKRRELERHLRDHGVKLLREGGNHSFWGLDAERSTAVPRQHEIDHRLARKICKDLGIPRRTRRVAAPPGSCDHPNEHPGERFGGPRCPETSRNVPADRPVNRQTSPRARHSRSSMDARWSRTLSARACLVVLALSVDAPTTISLGRVRSPSCARMRSMITARDDSRPPTTAPTLG
jgi:mRNA interferase HicA